MQLNKTLANSKIKGGCSYSYLKKKKFVYQLAGLVAIEPTSVQHCLTFVFPPSLKNLAWLLLHVLTQSLSGSAWLVASVAC